MTQAYHIFQENARREWRERPINPLFPILFSITVGLAFAAPSWEAAFIEAPFAVALAGAFWAAVGAFRFLREGSDDEPAHFRSLPRLGRIACGVFAAALLLFVSQGALHGADWSEAFASAAENPWRWAQLVAAILFSWTVAVIWIAMLLARGASALRRWTLRRIVTSRWSPSAAFRSLELWVRPTPEELASWESKLIAFELRKPLRALFRPKARRRETL